MSLVIEVYGDEVEERSDEEEDFTYFSEYFNSKDSALQAIAEFELSTSTKFNKLFRHKYNPYKSRIRWDPNSGIPFTVDESSKLECQHGKDRDFERKEKRKSNKNGIDKGRRKKYLRIETSKKKNCQACIALLEIRKYPQFQLDDMSKSQQSAASKKLRELLSWNCPDVEREYGCWVTFPSSSAHSGHIVGEAGEVRQPVDEHLVEKIYQLVDEGVISPVEIKRRLEKYVIDELFQDKKPPPPSNKRFYPTLKVIRSHYYRAYIDRKLDKGDAAVNMKVLLTLDPSVVERIAKRKILMTGRVVPPNPLTQISSIMDRIKQNISDVNSEKDLIKARDNLASILKRLQAPDEHGMDSYSSQNVQDIIDPQYPIPGTLYTEEPDVANGEIVLDPLYPLPRVLSDAEVYEAQSMHGHPEMIETVHVTEHGQLSASQFTPSIRFVKQQALDQVLLKNGPHLLSIVQLKCLEPQLDPDEKQLILSMDKSFREGWLSDDVVNSYFWSLCQEHKSVLYFPSTDAALLQRNLPIKTLWPGESIFHKRFVFVPWNPTGDHWILLAVDVTKKTLYYLDPVVLSTNSDDVLLEMANEFMSRLMSERFCLQIETVESINRTVWDNTISCGVLICMYAKWLASDENLVQDGSDYSYRKHIFECISGKLF